LDKIANLNKQKMFNFTNSERKRDAAE